MDATTIIENARTAIDNFEEAADQFLIARNHPQQGLKQELSAAAILNQRTNSVHQMRLLVNGLEETSWDDIRDSMNDN